ncbi:tryptophan-rich sensory protein [Candidatus Woesearchaeota archaeon]|nr:tryptophan-rich sensory protein [Candidatus Woesearchaeota archaeon]
MRWRTLALCLLISHAAGFIGSFFTASSVRTWYLTLTFPAFQPPSWLFGPVWLTLFTLIGIALYLVWPDKNASYWFAAHWVLNMLWSILFFGLQNPLAALVDIILLNGAIVGMISAFYRVNKVTLWLLLPYAFWVLFATLLNTAIVALN